MVEPSEEIAEAPVPPQTLAAGAPPDQQNISDPGEEEKEQALPKSEEKKT